MNERGILLTGDNIVGLGSVLIDPPQGNMSDLPAFAGADAIDLGSDGAFWWSRSGNRDALSRRSTSTSITDWNAKKRFSTRCELELLNPQILFPLFIQTFHLRLRMAERAVIAHLEKLEVEGKI